MKELGSRETKAVFERAHVTRDTLGSSLPNGLGGKGSAERSTDFPHTGMLL